MEQPSQSVVSSPVQVTQLTATVPPAQAVVRRVEQSAPMSELGIEFKTGEQLVRWAEYVQHSDLIPKDMKGKAANIVLCVENGMSLGLRPMQAIQSTYVVNGRPTIFGDMPLALCKASPYFDHSRFVEAFDGKEDDYGASCTVARIGGPTVTRRFTIKDAKRAKLWGKDGPWTFYPQRMLTMRARTFALRDVFSDVLKGVGIAPSANREDAADFAAEIEQPIQSSLPMPTIADPVAQVEAVAASLEVPQEKSEKVLDNAAA